MKILIVDGQRMFREVIRLASGVNRSHDIVGETGLGVEGVNLALLTGPDVLVLDLPLPDISGFSVASQLQGLLPRLRVLVVSASKDTYTLYRLEKLGVHGFVDKSHDSLKDLGDALELIEQGKRWFSTTYQAVRQRWRTDPSSFVKVLSDREHTVLELIGQGCSDGEIADALKICTTTAQTHRTNILRKLSISGTPKLIAFAINQGIVTCDPFPSQVRMK